MRAAAAASSRFSAGDAMRLKPRSAARSRSGVDGVAGADQVTRARGGVTGVVGDLSPCRVDSMAFGDSTGTLVGRSPEGRAAAAATVETRSGASS